MDNTGFSLGSDGFAGTTGSSLIMAESVAQWTFLNEEQRYFGSKVD
jgi:hypothetical protein